MRHNSLTFLDGEKNPRLQKRFEWPQSETGVYCNTKEKGLQAGREREILSSPPSRSHLTLFFGTYVIKQTFAVSVDSFGVLLIHYKRADRPSPC